MKILLHMCCGPCACGPLPHLLEEGHQVYGLFYNPNVHPYTEYLKREEAVEKLASHYEVPIIAKEEYDPKIYLQEVAFRENKRCWLCYQMRLKKAAEIAKKGRFDAFTTSLLVSPHQKHDLIRQIGEALAHDYEVSFYYQDWRPLYKETVNRSKELGLYRQQYCGCLYSEFERYQGRKGVKP